MTLPSGKDTQEIFMSSQGRWKSQGKHLKVKKKKKKDQHTRALNKLTVWLPMLDA